MTELNIEFALALQYRTPVITLETAVADFLPHLNIGTARKRAAKQALPFPVFQADGSKSHYMVRVQDLAKWLEESAQNATKDWQAMHG